MLIHTPFPDTSNVTGRHRGPMVGYRAPSLKRTFYLASASVTEFLVFVVECDGHHIIVVECGIGRFLCAMRVFNVRSSSSFPRLPLCQISFLWGTPLLS